MARTVLRVKPEALRDARLAFEREDGRRGLTRDELAEITGITSVHIWRLENKVRPNVTEPTMMALCNGLRVPPDALFERIAS